MNIWHDISPDEITPNNFSAVIEISKGSRCKYELDKKTKLPKVGKAKTSHTLNPVPMIIYDNFTADKYTVKKDGAFGLSNVAATTVNLLGYEAPEMWDESAITVE